MREPLVPIRKGLSEDRLKALRAGLEALLRQVDIDAVESQGEEVVVRVKSDGCYYVLSRIPRIPADVLTDREREIAELVAEGLGNKEIAGRLGIKTRTVAAHLRYVFNKLEVHNRTELARRVRLLVPKQT